MDPLSEVLSLLKPKSYSSGGFGVNGNFSLRFPKHQGIKCYAMVSGRCWLSLEGVPDAILLTAGNCFLLPRGLPFCLATDLSLPPVDFQTVLAALKAGDPMFTDHTGEQYMVGGHFLLTGNHADMLLKSLPPIVHIRKESDKADIRWSLDRMRQELLDPQPGSSLIAQHLAYVLIVQALRLHITDTANSRASWLFALTDPDTSKAITCMHDNPGHPWTLEDLAAHIGMSRSVFALKFKQAAGVTPMEYLTRWRMLLAADRLMSSSDTIAAIASSLGYGSESAFGKVFRKVMGCSPRQYGRAGNGTQHHSPALEPALAEP